MTTVYEFHTQGIDAHEVVILEPSEAVVDFLSITSQCSACGHKVFTGAPAKYATERRGWMQDHIDQHAFGRATDLEVIWTISADCTMCEDGGDIIDEDSETLRCQRCNTTWAIDGTFGELSDCKE